MTGMILLIGCNSPVSQSNGTTPESYNTVKSGQTFTTPQTIQNLNGVLIENCVFKDMTASKALYINNCTNVMVRNCTIQNITGPAGATNYALDVNNFKNVTIDNVVIEHHRSGGHPSALHIDGALSENITVKNCTIFDVDGNGISTQGTSTVDAEPGKSTHDRPIPGTKILNNLIYDTGLDPDLAGNSPKHGMYIKAWDCLIEGNTVYNCYDGQGLSVRSTGVVRGNTVYNCKSGPFCYWAQKPAGPSQKLIVENNLFYQTKNLTSGATLHTDVRLCAINPWQTSSGFKYDDFTVRYNTVILYSEVQTSSTIPVIYIGNNYNNAKVYGNLIVDLRTVAGAPRYLSTAWGSTSTSTLAKNSSNYMVNNLNDFLNPGSNDFRLKETSAARGYASGETGYSVDAGAYAFGAP